MPSENLTQKFVKKLIEPEKDMDAHCFALNILEKALESIVNKFRKRLTLIKPPLEKLLLQIETKPEISSLKKLFAVKKSISCFIQDVENVSKILKEVRTEIEACIKIMDSDVTDMDDILDFLIVDIEDIEGEVKTIDEMIEETDQFVNSHQDNVRNELMKMGLIIEILAVTLGFGAVVGGIFGMNVVNHLEQDSNAFLIILVGMIVFMVSIFAGFLLKYHFLKKDTSKAQSFNVLKNFFRAVDDLEFQHFKKVINKDDFVEAVKKITRLNISDKEADFLFQMVDINDDGIIDTETELVLGGTPRKRRPNSFGDSILEF